MSSSTGEPVSRAIIRLEDVPRETESGEDGRFVLDSVPPGPQVLRIIRIGFAPLRHPILVPPEGNLNVELVLAASALALPGLIVTSDPAGRARGELTTASVIEREAIRNQGAASLAGILELIPGVVVSPPGLDGVQQISLRAVPTSAGGAAAGVIAGQPSGQELAAFGTQIIIDGIPASNNANFQGLGVGGELRFPSSAGGGVDLRRFPAATIERVEVIRGIPSARFGDLTQGTIVVDTRAGHMQPEGITRADSRSLEASVVGGRALGVRHTVSGTFNVTRTLIAPGQTDELGSRLTVQGVHRLEGRNLVLDTRIDGLRVVQDRPERPTFPGIAYRSSDAGLRVSERARLTLGAATRLDFWGAFEGLAQRSFSQSFRLRGAMPVTDALVEGRNVGRYFAGPYLAKVNLEGNPRHLYWRTELTAESRVFAASHTIRSGVETRREWNRGAGLQFDIAFPPQTEFNGVNGFARPRRLDSIPALQLTGFYFDDRATWVLGQSAYFAFQGGVRLELLHEGGALVRIRDAVVEPRVTAELSPKPPVRFRLGAGRMAKAPSLASLYPAPQYHDLINVNYYADEPAERLAVITTRILDPTNPSLGFIESDHLEAGMDLEVGSAVFTLAGFLERTRNAVGFLPDPIFLIRDRYALAGAVPGSGRPPTLIEPPYAQDTVPVFVNRPAPVLTVRSRGVEVTATLPQVPGTRTRAVVNAAWTRSAVHNAAILVNSTFSDFQLSENIPRAPYWDGTTGTGSLLLATARIVHHQPSAGLVVTATVQATLRERRRDIGATDTLSFAGYVTRSGELVAVEPARRGGSEFADLRVPLRGQQTEGLRGPADWLLSLQVAKSLPLNGRFAFYAFNALDRIGNYGDGQTTARLFARMRFGVELTMPVPLWQ